MKPAITRHLVLATALLFALAACEAKSNGAGPGPQTPKAEAAAPNPLDGEWTLLSIDATPILAGSTISLVFGGDKVHGTAGCNGYSGDFTLDAEQGSLSFGELTSSTMACAEPAGVLEQEAQYLDDLHATKTYALENGKLSLRGKKTLLFSRHHETPEPTAALEGSKWALHTLIDGELASSTVAGSQPWLRFQNGKISGHGGCNHFDGEYTFSNAELAVQRLGATELACGDVLLDQESAIHRTLSTLVKHSIAGAQLRLEGKDGRALVLSLEAETNANPSIDGAWLLQSMRIDGKEIAALAPPATPNIHFEAGSMKGSTGCNNFDGEYTVEGQNLNIARLGATELGCDDARGEQERLLLSKLRGQAQFSIENEALQLRWEDGTALVFIKP